MTIMDRACAEARGELEGSFRDRACAEARAELEAGRCRRDRGDGGEIVVDDAGLQEFRGLSARPPDSAVGRSGSVAVDRGCWSAPGLVGRVGDSAAQRDG